MANISSTLVLLFPLLVLVLSAANGAKLGGRIPVKNVGSNKEVQDLGRYSVQEYNRMLQHQHKDNGRTKLLTFSEVVEAETQVVSGINYYLKISAAVRGDSRTYDAVVWVKPWLHTKELVDFKPAPAASSLTNTK